MFGNDTDLPTPKRNTRLALFLAIMLGPIGIFYATVTGAAIMLVINVVLGVLTYGLAVIVLWPLGVKIAQMSVRKNNLIYEQKKSGNQGQTLKQSSTRLLPFPANDENGDAIEKKLTRLRSFKDKDLISEEEYESKKRELMAGF